MLPNALDLIRQDITFGGFTSTAASSPQEIKAAEGKG